jgi:hypothetical protein
MSRRTLPATKSAAGVPAGYAGIHGGIVELLDAARHAAARSVNALMTASYWEIGRRIVEAEQRGRRRAGYGDQLIARLSSDLTTRFGRGFSADNLENMRRFFLAYPRPVISETPSRKSGSDSTLENSETACGKLGLAELAQVFTLPWSAYVRLLSVSDDHARRFYEDEAVRGVRQFDRQINSQFYERTALSKNKAVKASRTTRQPGPSSGPPTTVPCSTFFITGWRQEALDAAVKLIGRNVTGVRGDGPIPTTSTACSIQSSGKRTRSTCCTRAPAWAKQSHWARLPSSISMRPSA